MSVRRVTGVLGTCIFPRSAGLSRILASEFGHIDGKLERKHVCERVPAGAQGVYHTYVYITYSSFIYASRYTHSEMGEQRPKR